jgi:hypothetical protein
MQQRQDSVLLEIQRQNRLLLDSIRDQHRTDRGRARHDGNQLRQFEQNASQLGQLVGQVMGSLNRIEQRLTALEQRASGGGGAGGRRRAGSGGGTAEEYYGTGMQMMSQQSYATARMAFEQLVQEFPSTSARRTRSSRSASRSTTRSSSRRRTPRWSRSPSSGRSAARAGRAVPGGRHRRGAPRLFPARGYYEQVRADYRRSEEARQAQQKLQSAAR